MAAELTDTKAAEAPRILGSQMRWTDNGREACWEAKFGSVFVWLYPAQAYLWGRRFWVWHVGTPACQGSEHKEAEAVTAIERELIAIRDAIPAPVRSEMSATPCEGCGKLSSIFTAGCDHCEYEDK